MKFSIPRTAHVHCLAWGLYYCGQKSSQIKYEFINRQAPITKRKRWQLHRHCRPAAFRAEAIGSTQGRPVASGGGGFSPPVFGQTVNPISTRGADCAHHSTTYKPPRIFRSCDGPARPFSSIRLRNCKLGLTVVRVSDLRPKVISF